MPRFFVDQAPSGKLTITGDDARHIALSLRMKVGEEITVCGGGVDTRCVLEDIHPEEVRCKVVGSSPSAGEPDIELRLYQAMPKGDKAEFIVQKAVELGASEIVFMLTERCVARPDQKSFAKKLVRYNKIALGAAQQSGRGKVPKVRGLLTLSEAADEVAECGSTVWCYEKGGGGFSELKFTEGGSVALMVGSEGGFGGGEAEYLLDRGIKPYSLGARILRCETAPIAAMAIIMNLSGNM